MYLFKHACPGRDLLNNAIVEDSLSKHSQGLVLRLDTKILGLEIDVDVSNVFNTGLLRLGITDNPTAKLIVGAIAAAVLIAVLIAIFEGEALLKVVRELLRTGFDGCLGCVDGPLNSIFIRIGAVQILGFRIDTTGELIITTSFDS